MRRFFGVVVLLLGVTILGWVGFNLLIERQPEAEGRNPLPATLMSAGMIYVGVMWVRGKTAG